jgi:di/tricarboxylate transporter
MNLDIVLTLVILTVMFGVLLLTKINPVAIFVGALTLTITFRLSPLEQSLKGFSNPGVLTIGSLFIVAAGMYSTGAITILADKLIGYPRTLLKAQIKILAPMALGSAFLNNTPLVAMAIPLIKDLSRTCRLPLTRLLIPLSYASILGGTCTLIGTATNLVINGLLNDVLMSGRTDLPPMHSIAMFDPAKIGVPITIVGLGFIMVTSRWLLPASRDHSLPARSSRSFRTIFVVNNKSSLIGKSVEEAGFTGADDFALISIIRADQTDLRAEPTTILAAGDRLRFSAQSAAISRLWLVDGLEPGHELQKIDAPRHTNSLIEMAVARRSRAIGKTVGELKRFSDSSYGINLVGISRDGQPTTALFVDTRIQAGDVLVAEVGESFFYAITVDADFTISRKLTEAKLQRTDKALAAILITLAMIVLVSAGLMSMLNAALLAGGAMIITRCLSIRDAGKSLDFSTLIVIACAIGLESSVSYSGLSAMISNGLMAIGEGNLMIALTMVFIGCILMDTFVTNVASAVFMFPIALQMASSFQVSFMPFVMTVLVGASCSFISPIGYQTNLMVYGPGAYKFSDFIVIGLPLTIVVGIVTIFLIPTLFPF